MTARYLMSAPQTSLMAAIRAADTSTPDFYVRSPLVIDARPDAANFRQRVHEERSGGLARDFASGRLRYVSQLRAGAYDFAREKVEAHYKALDKEGLATLLGFLEDWRSERQRAPGQQSKAGTGSQAFGIDILLPVERIRLSYDLPSLLGL